ncbi:MAG: hypothetical protein RL710_2316 [Pseudomonadota bacterium]
MAIATINRFISLFDQAFQALSCPISMVDAERLAIVVHHSMDSKTRAYHTASHVFDVCEGMGPLQVLAALFHDVVYVQLDGGFPLPVIDLLQDFPRNPDGSLVLREIRPDDRALSLCAAIFEFKAGQVLPLYDGMNEFLSAVVAARLLQDHLSTADLIAVVACIEATIPFRAQDAQGCSATDRLAERVKKQFNMLVSDADPSRTQAYVNQVISDAACLANRDVSGFAKTDPGLFLSSTWLLIDESNAPLARAGVYSMREYRIALMRMVVFLASLNPAHIFQHYNAKPSVQEVASLSATAQDNITFACDFLDAKITSMAIIEALALCTGTDCPVSMFLGDIRSNYGRPDRVEDFLPEAPSVKAVNAALLNVFEKGRTLESTNDLTASPLTAFVYRYMGHEGTAQVLCQAKLMFDGDLSPRAFLQTLDRDMVCAIIRACANIALSRKDALLALAQSL